MLPTTDELRADMQVIASDATDGRNNTTAGSLATQAYLIDQLKPIAQGLNGAQSGDDTYKQQFPSGTNIVAVIPGSELPNEYVVVGAHYDHLGHGCPTAVASDTICNGATDNAAGVANTLAIARAVASDRTPPRRSVIFAFWDREEDGLLGSQYFVQNPLRPLSEIVGYVNFDIQGANLLPSLRNDTFAVGAETGGSNLEKIAVRGGHRGGVQLHRVSWIFGQGRSDYTNFINAQIPTVFFSDSTGPCYHTAQDNIDVVDFKKLQKQARGALSVVRDLVKGDRVAFVPGTPLASYDDALALRPIVDHAKRDLARFTVAQQSTLLKFRDDVHAIIKAGRANFDANDVSTLLGDAANAISLLTTGACDGFLRS